MYHLLNYFAQNLNVPIPNPAADTAHIKAIINIFLSVAGAVALLVITIAGFRYAASRGTPGAVTQARDAIIYSLIGLVIIISAFAIVNFVVFQLK